MYLTVWHNNRCQTENNKMLSLSYSGTRFMDFSG